MLHSRATHRILLIIACIILYFGWLGWQVRQNTPHEDDIVTNSFIANIKYRQYEAAYRLLSPKSQATFSVLKLHAIGSQLERKRGRILDWEVKNNSWLPNTASKIEYDIFHTNGTWRGAESSMSFHVVPQGTEQCIDEVTFTY
jgi:hypothetical protein